jgi:hypothetical protein
MPESFANFDPATSSWRTSQLCLLEGSSVFSETWPRAGMTRNGTAYRLRPLAPLTAVTGCFWLPTPAFNNNRESNRSPSPGAATRLTLLGMAKTGMWPTPSKSDGEGSRTLPPGTTPTGRRPNGKKAQVGLNNAVKMWATPSSRDWKDTPGMAQDAFDRSGKFRNRIDQLARQVYAGERGTWPTPVAGDSIGARNATSSRQPGSRHNSGTTLTDAVIQTGDLTLEETETGNRVVGGALNPTWVEWLMGFPLGWTDCEGSATP